MAANEIEVAIGKAKKKPSFLGGSDESGNDKSEPDMDDDEGAASADEVAAYKAMEKASSPEDKAKALKTFIKLCTEEGY